MVHYTSKIILTLMITTCFLNSIGQKLNTRAPDFELRDQFDKPSRFSFPSGKKTMLVFADRSSSKQVSAWTNQLKKDYPNQLSIVGIAVMGWIPFFIRGYVMDSFADKPQILLDWGDKVAEQYSYESDKCLLVFVDEQGMVRWYSKGAFDQAAYSELKTRL